MNIQELKERVIGCFSPYKDHWYLKSLDKVFEEYEQSNKSDLEEFKDKFADFPSCRQEIQGMKKEIEALKKQVEAICEVKVHNVDKYYKEEKQERFYYKVFESAKGSDYCFTIEDRNNKFRHQGLCSQSMAIDLCRYLNSMEASK